MKRSLLLVFLLAAAAGCGGPDVVGKYAATTDAADAGTPAAKMTANMLAGATLELKPDKTFLMTVMVPFEGTWSASGSEVTLTFEKMMGMSMDEAKKLAEKSPFGSSGTEDWPAPAKFAIEDGGKRLVSADKKNWPVVWTRE